MGPSVEALNVVCHERPEPGGLERYLLGYHRAVIHIDRKILVRKRNKDERTNPLRLSCKNPMKGKIGVRFPFHA